MKANHILTILVLATLSACTDLIETDLSHERVKIVAPVNNTVSSSFSQQFIWEEVEGATNYQLQIVRPDFSAVQQYILDTSIATRKFTHSLAPGTYQWRVRAINNSSQTEFSVCNLTIDSSLDLSGQTPVLISPADNFFSTNFSQTFSWQTMPNATSYVFQVLSTGSVIHTASISGLSTTYLFAADGTYQWRVFAQNATSGSAYATRTITIDNSAPAAPVLLLPIANDTIPNPVLLSWTSDPGIITDSVYIYADTNLTILTIADQVTSGTYSFSGTIGEDYFWRVKSKDAAGNWGPFSLRRKFIISP